MTVVFYDWPYSPFCMKVRAILDYKSINYQTIKPLAARAKLRRHGTGKVPAVEIDDAFISDSTDIAYALEERFPAPPLLPPTDHERGLCHAIEEWADESLYFLGLYYRWFELEGRMPVAAVFGNSFRGRLIYRHYLRLILKQLEGQGTLRKSPEHVRRDLERNLDAVDSLLTRGRYALGATPYLCDFALWGQLNYLSRTPAAGRSMRKRPAIMSFIERLKAASGLT
jgi:glutathione S-transferase